MLESEYTASRQRCKGVEHLSNFRGSELEAGHGEGEERTDTYFSTGKEYRSRRQSPAPKRSAACLAAQGSRLSWPEPLWI